LAGQFNSILSKSAKLDFYKMRFKDIPNCSQFKSFLSALSEEDMKIANTVLNHKFFKKVFNGATTSGLRTQEEEILSAAVNRLMEQLTANIETVVKNFMPSSDLDGDKITLSTTLNNLIASFEVKVANDAMLDLNDRNILLASAAFQKQTVPGLIDLALSIATESSGGRVLIKRFWKIVVVVLATVAAAAAIGAAAGALIATINGSILGSSAAAIGTAAKAASWIGVYVGASIGAVVGAVAGAAGYCPADGWFKTSIPLVDWEADCI
jgi:hypothetical protein